MKNRLNFVLTLGLILLIIFLVGCSTITKIKPLTNNTTLNNTEIDSNTTKIIETNQTKTGACQASWKCVGKWKKSYLSADCQWSQESECTLGCENGQCNVGQVCTTGFKCIDTTKLGYQTESCSWINTKKCPGGCLNAECLPEPEKNETTNNETNEVVIKSSAIDDSTKTEEAPKETIYTTKLIETTNLILNNKNYTISIYNMEAGRVKIKVNNIKSDWLSEGQSQIYNSEITLTVKDIFYQAYGGGKQEVSYVVK